MSKEHKKGFFLN